ncbi:MAG: BREX-1 system adenine-specific DNA-methyltransferase PglX [Candidatus Methanoperedens sp.]|nr:BREX-1 system adenine-specific DNA-methyltransferase PglX [Candidatus Methanoperedens sp.]
MKLEDQVLQIKNTIKTAYEETLSRSGLLKSKKMPADAVPKESLSDRNKLEPLMQVFLGEMEYQTARSKLIEELTFTLFNQIAALKVIDLKESNSSFIIERIIQRPENAGLSFAHLKYISEHPEKRDEEFKGLRSFLSSEFEKTGKRINLYSAEYPFNIMPETSGLKKVIDEFNKIDEKELKSDDFLGFCYEYYNRDEKRLFKDSGAKIEFDKVSLSSQIYTPSWVVEFILNNSLGKLWMEMHPESHMKNRRNIANIPDKQTRAIKPVEELKFIDLCCGSGNFFHTAFDIFFEMYTEAGYKEKEIPEKILSNNLYGIDLDDRAIQIAHLGLFIKALEKNPDFSMERINIVSTDFHLPEFEEVKRLFEGSFPLIKLPEIWEDIRQAEKFGSLIDIKSKIIPERKEGQRSLNPEEEHETQKEVIKKIKTVFQKNIRDNSRSSFINRKAAESMTFVDILTQKYDVAASNPPYTDGANYGIELKKFVEKNYKKRNCSFNTNLYACFFKRNCDIINEAGKVGMIHPLTFMFIKTFEDMRKYIINNLHINLFVHMGLDRHSFNGVLVDPAIYILENGDKLSNKNSTFIRLIHYLERDKKSKCLQIIHDISQDKENSDVYRIDQEKLKVISGWPFIYWISDSFREKFTSNYLNDVVDVRVGCTTSNNIRFLRYWWEVDQNKISYNYLEDSKKWIPYAKGGPFNKWYGNLWLVVNWENNGTEIHSIKESVVRNEDYYLREGLTYSSSGSKGATYRLLPKNHIFDSMAASLFLKEGFDNIYYIQSLLNSQFANFIIDGLNPTAATQVGDNKRVPFVYPSKVLEKVISQLSFENVSIKKHLCEFSIIERNYKSSPFSVDKDKNCEQNKTEALKVYLKYENKLYTQILLNESIIDEKIFEVYQLTESDKQIVLEKERISVGSLSIIVQEGNTFEFLKKEISPSKETAEIINEYLKKLECKKLDSNAWQSLVKQVEELYKMSKSIEDISLSCQVNPLTVLHILNNSSVIPEKKSQRIAQEFVLDQVRTILKADDDGIVPVSQMSGEKTVYERLLDKLDEEHFSQKDIQFLELLLGKRLDKYLETEFFKDECDILNKFMYLPMTPFIWHLSSGEAGGIDLYTIIYNWSRDKLLKIKSVYAQKRKTGLENRLAQLSDGSSIKIDEEKEIIQKQLMEIDEFCKKIDKIASSGYSPVLDNGVGKNIAPLQKEKMLKTNVLTEKELEIFLNADW